MATVCVQRTPVHKGLDTKPDIFMGDDESLVDRLIASCEAHKTFTPTQLLPGFGRDLVPYYGEGEFEASVSVHKTRPAKQQVVVSGPTKGQKRGQGERPAGKRSPDKSRARHDSPSVPTAADASVARSLTPTRDVEPPRGRPSKADKRPHTAVPPAQALSRKASLVEKQWAGPCYHASPEPESLPMPGELLFPSGNSASMPKVNTTATLVLKSILQVAST
jgi:hypothetical protein